jgi:hypothetical protein
MLTRPEPRLCGLQSHSELQHPSQFLSTAADRTACTLAIFEAQLPIHLAPCLPHNGQPTNLVAGLYIPTKGRFFLAKAH